MLGEDATKPASPTTSTIKMDHISKVKQERSILRRLFTISINKSEEIFKCGEGRLTDITCEYNKISQLHHRLLNLNDIIKGDIIDEGQLEKEILGTEEYIDKYVMVKSKFDIIINKCTNKPHEPGSNKRRFKLPEVKFVKFNGEIRQWLPFWGQFKKIDADPELDNDDKLYYLMQSIETNTDVYSLVSSYPPNGDSYRQCINELKQRYAREELLIEVYVRELLALILHDKSTLVELHDKLNAHLRALESLGIKKYHAFILPLVETALPMEILKIWERTKGDVLKSEKNSEELLQNLMSFLKRELESMQRVKITKNMINNDKESVATESCLLTKDNKIKSPQTNCCLWCNKTNHISLDCYKLHNLTLEQRRDIVKKKKACSICLKTNHHAKMCKAFVKCLICKKRHSTALCPGKGEEKHEDKSDAITSLSTQNYNTQTLLQTFIVNIRSGKHVLPVRCLYDSGSQRSYIREDIAKKLKLTPTGMEKLNHCLFGNVRTNLKTHNVYDVYLESLDSKFKIKIEALSQNIICQNLPKLKLDYDTHKILGIHQILLTDTMYDISNIDILIGSDYAGLILTNNFVVMENGLVAIKTKFGWTVQGKQISTTPNNISSSMFCMSVSNDNLTDFWKFETLGIHDPAEMISKAQGEAEAVHNFEESVRILADGRYEVELPFKVGFDDLLSNYDMARKRLDSNTKKLISSGKYHDYDAILQEWLTLGIIEKSPTDLHHGDYKCGHYLPHKAVLKESSLTSAIRPVFDASCQDKNGLSLNACLEKGINFIEHIPKLLIRFRKGAIGITSDIAKAFLQISLRPEERKYLKFLWWEDESMEKVVELRHCRVVFGLTCSPFLLSATIMHHLKNISGQYKQTAQLLQMSFYVDNCLTSLDSEEEAHKFIRESKEIMEKAQFDLRMWTTSPLHINEAGREIISVLGLNWNTSSDEISCNIDDLPPLEMLHKLTKRVVLSLTQKVFDPIGFTCPVNLVPKLLLREMWHRKLTWDQPLPQDIAKHFLKWYSNLHYLKQCAIPRRLAENKLTDCALSLHMFCDASKDAIATCIFLRAEKDNKVSVQLIAAKSEGGAT